MLRRAPLTVLAWFPLALGVLFVAEGAAAQAGTAPAGQPVAPGGARPAAPGGTRPATEPVAPGGVRPAQTAPPDAVRPGEPTTPAGTDPVADPTSPTSAAAGGEATFAPSANTATASGELDVGLPADTAAGEDDELAVGAVTEPAPSETERPSSGFTGRLGLGFSLPTLADDFLQLYQPGAHIGVMAGARLGDFAIGLSFDYVYLPFNEFSLLENSDIVPAVEGESIFSVDVDGGGLHSYELLLQGRWTFAHAELDPYLLFGGGITIADPAEINAEIEGTDTMGNPTLREASEEFDTEFNPTGSVGIGATDAHGSFELFGEVRGDLVLTDDELVPIIMVRVGAGF